MAECLLVGLGGGIGAMGRFIVGKISLGDIPYPINTFIVNVVGAFLIGLFYAVGARLGVDDSRIILFLTTGLCGGFTTMSTFSREMLTMIENGRVGVAVLYCMVTVVICVVATWLGACAGKIDV